MIFCFLQLRSHTVFAQKLYQRFMLRHAPESAEQCETTFSFVAIANHFLGIIQILIYDFLLCLHQFENARLQIVELMFIASRKSHEAIEQLNSPLCKMLRSESLWPPDENITIGGRSLMALKKL